MAFAFENKPQRLRIQQFVQTALEIEAISAKYGVTVLPFHSSKLPVYAALSGEKQREALKHLQGYLCSMQTTESAGAPLDNQERALWFALSALEVVPSSQLFTILKTTDVVEIYDMDNLQIWRNLNFMRICSYTLEEIYCLPWVDRYRRSEEALVELGEKVGKFLAGQTPDLYHAQVSDHRLEETLSVGRFSVTARHEWLVRLRDRTGNAVAWIGISQAYDLNMHQPIPNPSRRALNLVPQL